jgi:hypothetical protein
MGCSKGRQAVHTSTTPQRGAAMVSGMAATPVVRPPSPDVEPVSAGVVMSGAGMLGDKHRVGA